jgi:hypothetical protein
MQKARDQQIELRIIIARKRGRKNSKMGGRFVTMTLIGLPLGATH